MFSHSKTICVECGIIITQCRCMKKDKKTIYDVCNKCKKVLVDDKIKQKTQKQL